MSGDALKLTVTRNREDVGSNPSRGRDAKHASFSLSTHKGIVLRGEKNLTPQRLEDTETGPACGAGHLPTWDAAWIVPRRGRYRNRSLSLTSI